MNVSLAAAVRGDFVREPYPGGWVGAAVLGRLLSLQKRSRCTP
jgi:hypothetical protein